MTCTRLLTTTTRVRVESSIYFLVLPSAQKSRTKVAQQGDRETEGHRNQTSCAESPRADPPAHPAGTHRPSLRCGRSRARGGRP
jgi:hypothetical protein